MCRFPWRHVVKNNMGDGLSRAIPPTWLMHSQTRSRVHTHTRTHTHRHKDTIMLVNAHPNNNTLPLALARRWHLFACLLLWIHTEPVSKIKIKWSGNTFLDVNSSTWVCYKTAFCNFQGSLRIIHICYNYNVCVCIIVYNFFNVNRMLDQYNQIFLW